MNDDLYEHNPPIQVARAHLSRYPRHYGALGLFLVAMLVVPAVGAPRLAELAAAGNPAPASAPAASPAAPAVAPSPPPVGGSSPTATVADLFDVDPDTVTRAVEGPVDSVAVPPTGGVSVPEPADAPDEGQDAGPGGLAVPPPPALPLPPVPEELRPLLAVVTPLTTQGCSALGLAAVVAAVAGTAAQDVPVGQLLPYLAPVYSACATFPPPSGDPTVCALDDAAHEAGYPKDVSGLMKTPNAIGAGVDVLYGIEAAVEAYTGQAPGLVAGIAEQLGCR